MKGNIAHLAFEAYHCRLVPEPPDWDSLSRQEKDAWMLAANAVYRQARQDLVPTPVEDLDLEAMAEDASS